MDQRVYEERPLISVVMCAYNGMPYIKEAVACLLNQTYTNWELILSDDGSTDGTRDWVNTLNDERIRLFLHEKNMGYVANKNFAHQQAKGEYITQLDNDDTSTPDRLEKQLAAALKNPKIKIIGCGFTRIDEQSRLLETVCLKHDQLITVKGDEHFPFWFPSLFVHRSVFDRIGFFSTYFSGVLGDDIYWTICALEKHPIYCLKEPLYGYRYSATSITNVLNNKRKLIIEEVLREIFRQRKDTGTDWIEQNNYTALQALENKLLHDRKFMSEQYRVWAAKAVDKNNFKLAKEYLKKSFNYNFTNLSILLTLKYYIQKKVS